MLIHMHVLIITRGSPLAAGSGSAHASLCSLLQQQVIVAAWHIVGHHLHGVKVHMWGKAISIAVHWACWIRA